jgi:hypothetical protein
MKHTIIIVAMLAVLPKILIGTEVCGNVSGVWDLTGSPYYVTCDVTVPAGQTLEIRPGVQVLFIGHHKFNVYGDLQAIGTEEDSVVFTTDTLANPSRWDGIKFSGQACSESHLFYCRIENGLSVSEESHEGAGVRCGENASPTFSHCTFRNNRARWGGGANVSSGSSPTFSYCIFVNNSAQACGGAITVADDGQTSISHCTFVGNRGEGWQQAAVCIYRSTVTVSNSIVAFSADYGVVFDNAPNSHLRFCDIYGNPLGNIRFWSGPADGPAGVGEVSATIANGDPCDQYQNILLNPLFVNAANGDFHLQTGSPCINAGDPASPRDPDGTIADMGAFPFTGGTPDFGFVTAVSLGPPNWEYELHWVSGSLDRLTFKPVCPGTTGSATGLAAAAGWSAIVYTDSVVFTTATPLTSGSLSGFVLSHPSCNHPLTWVAGDNSGMIDGPLPVELASFNVIFSSGGIQLSFSTASETDNDFFEIMRGTSQAGAFSRIATLPSQGNSASGHSYEYLDREVTAGRTYWYYLTDVDLNGNRTEHRELMRSATMTGAAELPSDYSLAAYPNPFNPNTTISFALPEADVVRIAVYDVAGRWIQTLVNEKRSAGNHTVTFDARDLPSGVYFARMESGPFTMTKKMLLIR